MSSVRSIAQQAGVSITTVSRALNNDPKVSPRTREHVLAVANRCGYVATVGRRLTTQIALAYTGTPTLAHPFDAAVLDGIVRGVDESRYDVLVLNLQRDRRPEESFTQFFMRKGVRGVILRTMADERDICQAIAEEGFPSVVLSERFDSPDISYLDCNSKPDSTRAVEYLIDLGHRRIAFAMHNVPDLDHADRLQGYREALQNHGIEFNDHYVFLHPYTLTGGSTVMRMIMSMTDQPTAIYFADPMMAVGAFKQANRLGVRVPEDISIIGFDDTNIRHSVHPTMTAVCQDARRLGIEAARQLTRMLGDAEHRCLQKTLRTFFEVHESTGPPAGCTPKQGTHFSARPGHPQEISEEQPGDPEPNGRHPNRRRTG